MAVPSTSTLLCYQAVRRHLRPQYESIWVPDSLLISAFERYAATFRAAVRHGSSVPGPMEHRKRMAKRNMGELHLGQPHPAAPLWELVNLVDLTQWKWEPPTSPVARRPREVDDANSSALAATGSSPLQTYIPPVVSSLTDDIYTSDELLLPEDITLNGVAEGPPPVPWSSNSTAFDVVSVALESLARDRSCGAGANSRFELFCDYWRRALTEGLFHGEAISKVLTGIIDAPIIESISIADSTEAENIKLCLIEATIDGISSRESGQSISFDLIAWNSILRVVSTIGRNTIRVFTKAMASIPEDYISAVSSRILDNLDVLFNSLGQAALRPSFARQTAKMAMTLRCLGQAEHRFILNEATQRALAYTDVEGVNYAYVRLSWLLLLARLPNMDLEYLAQTCVVLDSKSTGHHMTETDVCQIFLSWANSQALVERYAGLCKTLLYDGTKCYYTLGMRLWKTRQFHVARILSAFLRAISRETHITSLVKGASNPGRKKRSRLASVALLMRRPLAALDIACLYEESRRRGLPFWRSQLGFKALEILTWVPNLKFRKLWRIIGIISRKEFSSRQRQRRGIRGLSEAQITKIAAVGIVTGLSPHLTQRKAFAILTTCYLNLQRHNSRLPASFLRALLHYVTRQFDNGKPGITAQLRYVLHIIRQHMGQQDARSVALAMQQRRNLNFGLR